ncbi:putative G3BP-like protein [Tanacetum coccineum]
MGVDTSTLDTSFISDVASSVDLHLQLDNETYRAFGELLSTYVRNLPMSITSQEIYQEFKKFGSITQNGVFLKIRLMGKVRAKAKKSSSIAHREDGSEEED